MYNFKIAIPTYSRPKTLLQKSLSIIERNDFPLEQLFIFIVEDQLEDYKKVLPSKYHERLIVGAKEKGLVAQRNFMTNYFKQDEPILYMDDDLRDIKYLVGPNYLESYPLKHFNSIFHFMKEEGVVLSGFYPTPNAYFMNEKRVKGLVYITGGLYCFFNKKDIELTYELIEDFERTTRVFSKYGPVMRFNSICADTRGFIGAGGMNANKRDPIESLEQSMALQAEYPELIDGIKQLRNGFFNPVFFKKPNLKLNFHTKISMEMI